MTQPIPAAPTPKPPGDPAPPTEPANPTTTPAPTPQAPDALGPAGIKALQAERDRGNALEQQGRALEQQLARLAPLQQLAEALGARADEKAGVSEVDALRARFDELNRTLESERVGRWRAEVAQEIGLSPQLAARLQGGTRDEILADAQALAALIPAAPAGPRIPVPDPTQGARGTAPVDLEAQIVEAQKNGDVRKVIALQRQKLLPTNQ